MDIYPCLTLAAFILIALALANIAAALKEIAKALREE